MARFQVAEQLEGALSRLREEVGHGYDQSQHAEIMKQEIQALAARVEALEHDLAQIKDHRQDTAANAQAALTPSHATMVAEGGQAAPTAAESATSAAVNAAKAATAHVSDAVDKIEAKLVALDAAQQSSDAKLKELEGVSNQSTLLEQFAETLKMLSADVRSLQQDSVSCIQ